MGAKDYNEKGSGTNILCLTLTPQFDDYAPLAFSHIVGAKHRTKGQKYYYTVYCAVCRAAQPTTIMVPGTFTCPSGWTADTWLQTTTISQPQSTCVWKSRLKRLTMTSSVHTLISCSSSFTVAAVCPAHLIDRGRRSRVLFVLNNNK